MADNVHEGDLDLSDVTSPEGLELPDKVTGDLDLRGLKSAEGLKLPEHVGGTLYGVRLSSSIEDEYDHEVHGPKHLGYEVYFSDPDDDW